MARLEARGFLLTKHGSGTSVTDWKEIVGLEMLPTLMSSFQVGSASWLTLVSDFMLFRRTLVAEVLAAASEKCQPEHFIELEKRIAEQALRTSDCLAYAAGDIAFQRALVKISGNLSFELVLNTFARFPASHPELITILYKNAVSGVDFYFFALELLKLKNASQVREIVRKALEEVDKKWMAQFG